MDMRNIWLVAKHAVGTTMRQRSFWLLTFLMPVLLVGFQVYSRIQEEGGGGGDTGYDPAASAREAVEAPELPAIALVDEGGLMSTMPPGFPPELFVRFPELAQARKALDAGEVEQIILIPPDYLETGAVTVYEKDFQILSSGENMGVAFHSLNEWVLGYLIDYNLTGDASLANAIRNPVPGALAEPHPLNPTAATAEGDQTLAELVSGVLPFVFYFLLIMGSSYLMRSVVAEKENRTAELLMLSLRPSELMAGKILAMSLVTMVQVVVWVGGGVWALRQSSQWFNVSGFEFPPGFLVWAALFLLFGFLLFASMMAAAGAVATNAREGGQMTWLLILPLMPTLMFGPTFLEQPNGILPLVLSLFPLSAPSAMVTRLAVADVPLWQPIVSLLGLIATTIAVVYLAGRFFRPGNLLSDTPFNWRRFATAWREPA
jgi:ABC-2 type transport system permease protein